MDAQTTVTVRCTACGKLGEVKPSCGCGAAFEYISPGELAAQAVKDNPGMSDRAIADKLGISDKTVGKARKATADYSAVETRVGKDGKKRKQSRGRVKRPSAVSADDWERFQAKAAAEGKSGAEVLGDLLADPVIDPKTLPKTTQEKLAVALRQQQRAQNAEFERRVAAEYTARVKRGFPELERMEREAREEKRLYERLRRESKKLGTLSDWNNLMFCLHPDTRRTASDEKFDAALRWVMLKKFAITGEK